jgi:hypothetical protein
MAIDFPNTPTLDDEFTVDDKTYVFDGAKWKIKLVATVISNADQLDFLDSTQFLRSDVGIDSNILPDANASRNIGSSSTRWDVVYASVFNGVATEAKYADLAEIYTADQNYIPGTVVQLGGASEVTQTDTYASDKVLGVVSSNPAYLMNSDCNGIPVALKGRVPCFVNGPVKKGDLLVSGTVPGTAEKSESLKIGTLIGKAIENKTTDDVSLIEIFVG